MPQHECLEVVVTAEDADWIERWSRSLVEERLAACMHRVAPIRAVYRWDGATTTTSRPASDQ